MSAMKVQVLPKFMGSEGGRFLTLQYRCADKPKAHIVFIPPFVEEMNRCRSLVAAQARRFAESGYACTLVDFYGTGDSQGELSDASLAIWQDNIRVTIEKLQSEESAPVILWGLRLGGLIALNLVAKYELPLQHIILWQPVTAGKVYVNQVLRQRVASLMVRELPAETTKEIRQRLAGGEKVEVAGYTLGGDLLRDIESIDLGDMKNLSTGTIYWLEHIIEEGKDLGLASQKAIAKLRELENAIEVHPFCDPPIWQIHERDFAPQLLAATAGLLP